MLKYPTETAPVEDLPKAVLNYLNDELADRLVKASALLQVLGSADPTTLNSQVLNEYTWAVEGLIKEARDLQARLWEWTGGAG